MSKYTVKQIARAAGVSVRTLHHYHEIGLLVPSHIGANGYRYYGDAEALRLQQILLYRDFGMPLSEVRTLLDAPDFSPITTLERHKARLEAEVKRLPKLIRTLDRTIETLKGNKPMNIETLYKAFPPEKQAAYEAELASQGPEMAAHLRQAKAHNAAKPEARMAADMAELKAVETAMAENMAAGLPADAAENTPLVARHRAWVSAMWGRECSPEAHAGLAQMYEAHPDFNQRYEAIAEGFTAYICAAIIANSARNPA